MDPKDVNITYEAVLDWMTFLGMYQNENRPPSKTNRDFGNIPQDMISGKTHLRRVNGPVISIDGIFSPLLPVGSVLEVGSVIGYIYDIHGSKRESVLSPHKGYLIALTDHAFVKRVTVAVLSLYSNMSGIQYVTCVK